jgi:DNA repair protein RecO (recombination protein O)
VILEKTQGIVLGLVPYNDKTSFAHIYTARFGRVSYSVPVSRLKRAKLPRSLFAPLNVLELEVKHTPGRDVQNIVEARLAAPHYGIHTDPVKNAVAYFLAEMVSRTVREQEENPALYEYLADAVELFDLIEAGKANFHLVFLARLFGFIGIRIDDESYRDGYWFDLQEGVFAPNPPYHPYHLTPAESRLLHTCLGITFTTLADYSFARAERKVLLNHFITYVRLHLPDLKELRTLEILSELFD